MDRFLRQVSRSFAPWASWNLLALVPALIATTAAWVVWHDIESQQQLSPGGLLTQVAIWSSFSLLTIWLYAVPAIVHLAILWRLPRLTGGWERLLAIALAPVVFSAVAMIAAWLTTLGGSRSSPELDDVVLYLLLLPALFGGFLLLPDRGRRVG